MKKVRGLFLVYLIPILKLVLFFYPITVYFLFYQKFYLQNPQSWFFMQQKQVCIFLLFSLNAYKKSAF